MHIFDHVGEKPTVTLYTYIIRHAAKTRNKTKTKYMMSIDYSSVCNIGFRVVWVSIEFVVVFFTLTYWASTIPSNTIHGCQSGMWSAGQMIWMARPFDISLPTGRMLRKYLFNTRYALHLLSGE